jgi:hypothetical protein
MLNVRQRLVSARKLHCLCSMTGKFLSEDEDQILLANLLCILKPAFDTALGIVCGYLKEHVLE